DTMGVKFVTVADSDSVVGIARNTEREVDEELLDGLIADDVTDDDGTTAEVPDASEPETTAPESSEQTQETAEKENGSE
ncbi:MAG: hypothetical protein ABJA81_06370, partial [Nocardioidaceae bacterium]